MESKLLAFLLSIDMKLESALDGSSGANQNERPMKELDILDLYFNNADFGNMLEKRCVFFLKKNPPNLVTKI